MILAKILASPTLPAAIFSSLSNIIAVHVEHSKMKCSDFVIAKSVTVVYHNNGEELFTSRMELPFEEFVRQERDFRMIVSHSVQRGSERCNYTATFLRMAGMRFVVAMACFFAGCSPDNAKIVVESNSAGAEGSTGQLKFQDNSAARKILEEIEQSIRSNQIASKDQVRRLLELHERFPNTAEITKTLTTAYISRKDWLSICQLFKSIDRELVDDALFVRSLILSMSFAEAVAFLENKNDRNSEENFLLGYSLYHNGEMQRAIVVLDDFVTAPSERLSEAMMIRGLAQVNRTKES